MLFRSVFPLLEKVKDEGSDTAPWRAYRYAYARGEREQAAAAELKGARPLPFVFPEPGEPPIYLTLSELLA